MLLRPPGNAPSSLSHPPRIGFLPQTNRYEAVCRLRGLPQRRDNFRPDAVRIFFPCPASFAVCSRLFAHCYQLFLIPIYSLSAIFYYYFILSLFFYILTISVKCIHFTYKTPSRSGNCCFFSFPKCREGFLLMWVIASFFIGKRLISRSAWRDIVLFAEACLPAASFIHQPPAPYIPPM